MELLESSALAGDVESEISDLAWIDDRHLAIADHHDHHIVIRSVDAADRIIGQSGAGPGEFSSIGSLLPSEDGILVSDPKLGRLTQMSYSGDYVRSIGVPGPMPHLLAWHGDQVAAIWVAPESGEMAPLLGSLSLETGEAVRSVSLFELVPSLREHSAAVPGIPSPFIAADARPDGLFVVAGGRNRYHLSVVDSIGTPRFDFGRPDTEPEMRSQREIERHLRSARRSVEGLPRADALMEQWRKLARETPKPFFDTANGVRVDRTGRTWVTTTRGDSDSTYVDLFSPEGEYMQTFTLRDRVLYLEPRLPLIAVGVIRRGGENDGAHGIDVYRVVE